MRECVIYARVSSKEQEREGHSIPAQLELLREYAGRQGFKVVKEFTEAETARSAGREQFEVMTRYLHIKSAPRIVLVEKTDRLYRNFRDYIALEDLMLSQELEVHLVKESEILTKDARSHLKFIHGIKVLMAKNYVDNLSEEVRKGQRQAILDGFWPFPPPYGYQTSGTRGLMNPHPEESEFVRAAFTLYASGHSIHSTIDKLHEMGLRYRSYAPKVGKTKLAEMLKNRLYVGDLEYHNEIFPGKHEPIVDRKTWNEIQHLKKRANQAIKKTRQEFTYRGILTCGECSGAYVGEYKKGGRYTYYCCVAMKRGCSQGYIKESVVDEHVKMELSRLLVMKDLRSDMLQAVSDMDALAETTYKDELNEIESSIDKARKTKRKAYQDRLDELIDETLWMEISQTYQEKIDLLLAKRERLMKADSNYMQTAVRMLELPERLARNWCWANSEEKKWMLGLFTSNFIVEGGKAVLKLKEPFAWHLTPLQKVNGGQSK